ncbi:MAG TPA: class II aldolase/adducin family protein [Candidatus Dormibacteraeota bacterium]|nr:class II aldolase/adducin family protein [Candidatus Dormibacteraeota bacterium]
MAVAHEEQRREVVWACAELVRLGLVAGTAGNVTIRIPGTDLIAASPSSVRYDVLAPTDVCIVDLGSGDTVEGFRNPTSELLMHSAVHRARGASVGAVIHAHSVAVTALSLLGRGVPPVVDEQVAILGGEIPLCPHELPGSAALAERVVEHLGDLRAVILAHHGMLGVGRDIHQAVAVCHLAERLAEVMLKVLPLGEPRLLPEEAQKLERAYYELSSRPVRPLFSA